MNKQRLKELALSASEGPWEKIVNPLHTHWSIDKTNQPLERRVATVYEAADARYIAALDPKTVLALLEEPKTVFAVYECGFDFYEDRALFMTREAAEEYIRKSTEGISPDLVALEIEERPIHSSAQEALEAT